MRMRLLTRPVLATLLALSSCMVQAHTQGVAAPVKALKVLTMARTSPFESLDPPRQFSLGSNDIVATTYNTLLRYSYLARPYKLEADLVERTLELSADGLTYTFTLRRGIRFHDSPCFPGSKGREMNAADVLFSLRRYADARVINKSWFAMQGAVAGLDAWRATTAKAAPGADLSAAAIPGLQKIDRHNLSIKLVKPNPLFLFALAMSPTAVVPPEAVRHFGDRPDLNPVGTDAFMLANAERKGVLRLTRNPNYLGVYPACGAPGDAEKSLLNDADRRLPLVDVVEIPLIEKAQPATLRFRNGELDRQALDRANFVKMALRDKAGDIRLNDEYARRFDLSVAPSLSVYYLAINMKAPLLGRNKALRHAAHLVDTPAEIEQLLNGRGRVAGSIVPLDLPGNERDTGAMRRGFDPGAARTLMAEAGYPGGRGLAPINITFQNTDSATRNRLDLYTSRFAAAGVVLKAQYLDYPGYVKLTEAGNLQIADHAWNADYPDAKNFYQLLYGTNLAPGPNVGSFIHPGYDRADEDARHMADGPARLALFREMNATLLDEAPILLKYIPLRVSVIQKWLRNFKRNLMQPEVEFLDIDLPRKAPRF